MKQVHKIILQMVGELERYQATPEKRFKTEKNFRTACDNGSRLLDILGERKVRRGDLLCNSLECQRFVHALKTLDLEANQEQIDKEIVKMAYQTVRKYTPQILQELIEYYLLCGPDNEKYI